MSITLISSPAPFTFSGDQIKAIFSVSDIYVQAGAYAINHLPLPSAMTAGNTYTLNYGGKSFVFQVATTPNTSGLQLKSRATTADYSNELQAELFKSNYNLRQDFEIVSYSGGVQFIAKRKGVGFNINFYNTTPGSKEILKSNLQVKFILYCENPSNFGWDNVYETDLTVKFGDDNIAEAIINDKLHNYISAEIRNNLPDIPDNDPLLCRKSCRRFYFEYAEMYGDPVVTRRLYKSEQFTVLHGGLSTLGEATKTLSGLIAPGTIDQDKFLKQGFALTTTRTDQPQYLYYFNTRDTKNVKLNLRFYFTDGSVALITPYSVEAPKHRKIAFNVTHDKLFIPDDFPTKKVAKYELFLTNDSGDRISDYWYYELDLHYRQYYRYFLNWSSWGTMDCRVLFGKGSSEFDLVQSEADKSDPSPLSIEKGSSLVFNKFIRHKRTMTTGFIKDRASLIFNRDLFLSVFIYVLSKGKMLPVKITSKTIPEIEDGNNLFAQKFDFEYLFEDSAFTEGDDDGAKAPPVRITGQVYSGPSLSKPITESDVLALPNSQSPELYLVTFNTGLSKYFGVATPFGKIIGTAYNQSTDENILEAFKMVNIQVDDQGYHLNTIEMSSAFETNQVFVLTLINE